MRKTPDLSLCHLGYVSCIYAGRWLVGKAFVRKAISQVNLMTCPRTSTSAQTPRGMMQRGWA